MHQTLEERRALLQETRLLLEERRNMMTDHRDQTQPRPDGADARDGARDQRELERASGGLHEAPIHAYRTSTHGDWYHEFRPNGCRWRWQKHPQNGSQWIEVLIIDGHGHVTPIALTEEDLLDIRATAGSAIRRLRRAGYQD